MIERTRSENAADTVSWRESVRGYVQTAWEALDRAEIVMYRQYKDTHDEHVGAFKRRFARAAAALIDLAVDEVYPPDEDMLPTDDPAPAEHPAPTNAPAPTETSAQTTT